MKKLIKALSIILVLFLIILSLRTKNYERLSVYITLGVFATLVLSYLYFESSDMGTKEIALIATLSSIAAVSRVPFAGLPNIQPTTFLVALSGLVFGSYQGFLVGSTAGFISNIFLGQGPWTPWQMMSWGIVGAITGFIGKKGRPIKVETFSMLCFLYGFLFDWIMNLWHVLGFVRPINIKTIALAYVTGLTFDIMHAVGNFLFAMIFYQKFYNILVRFKNRLNYTYIKEEN